MPETIDKPDWLTTIYAATIINAWYTALNLHFAEKGKITDEDRVAILTRVHSQARDLESYLITEGKQPLPTRDLMQKFARIARFSARAQSAD